LLQPGGEHDRDDQAVNVIGMMSFQFKTTLGPITRGCLFAGDVFPAQRSGAALI
jgi:hypothetical protein